MSKASQGCLKVAIRMLQGKGVLTPAKDVANKAIRSRWKKTVLDIKHSRHHGANLPHGVRNSLVMFCSIATQQKVTGMVVLATVGFVGLAWQAPQ